MSLIFPQINTTSYMMVQNPYTEQLSYSTTTEDLETGMRYAFNRRANPLAPVTYAQNPLGRFNVAYANITDAEVQTLQAFFDSCLGKYRTFIFLDPSGNLLQYSELFSASYWSKSTVTVGSSATDPFQGSKAFALTFASGTSKIFATIGPSGGGMQGFVLCASVWVKASAGGVVATLGFMNSAGTVTSSRSTTLPNGAWVRIYANHILANNNFYSAFLQLGAGATVNVFGFQVSPMKGEGAYCYTTAGGPGYGYHPNCRFDVDVLSYNVLGPNQNELSLPVVEVNSQ